MGMGKITFIAWLVISGIGCLFVGGHNLYENGRFWIDGQSGMMESADPIIPKLVKAPMQANFIPVDVTYVTREGRVQVSQKLMGMSEVSRLSNGGQIPVSFLKSNPRYALLDGKKLDSPWGWLIMGLILSVVARYAYRLLRGETPIAE